MPGSAAHHRSRGSGTTEAPAAPAQPTPREPEVVEPPISQALPIPAPPAPAPPAPAPPAPPAQADVYFPRCADARAAGAAPLYAGQPGYRAGLDGDGDGVACEPRR
ncbi:excalibur calcium-binding domain-containing protein [Kocuria atrinae]|uniref:excalibur calcium-binding domain-containing protein n=1 Tax=Kocuria atrinae TaxID=592377 RepID=UPI001CB99FCF|nr:excalibur calcium-binding domain-containing protein [Kocuria atrinae]